MRVNEAEHIEKVQQKTKGRTGDKQIKMTFCLDFDELQIPMLFYSVCQNDVRSREVPQHRANL